MYDVQLPWRIFLAMKHRIEVFWKAGHFVERAWGVELGKLLNVAAKAQTTPADRVALKRLSS